MKTEGPATLLLNNAETPVALTTRAGSSGLLPPCRHESIDVPAASVIF